MLIGWVPASSTTSIGPQLREGETGEIQKLPFTKGELLAGLAGFLDSAQAEPNSVLSRDTHYPS
jgi:hypothetical protein